MNLSDPEMEPASLVERARQLSRQMQTRRSIRSFSPNPVPREVIRAGLEIAASAPSGVNLQAWRFVAISDPEIRRAVRKLAEDEWTEFQKTNNMMHWLKANMPTWDSDESPHLEDAPWLIAVFASESPTDVTIDVWQNLHVVESACLATGFLVSAFHQLGLATLVHVPAAADYLGELAAESDGETLVLIVLVGYEREDAKPGAGDRRAVKKPFHVVATILGDAD